ncbi:MAG: hypothetical protein ACRC6V_07445 [Bacteroidales bacterium]
MKTYRWIIQAILLILPLSLIAQRKYIPEDDLYRSRKEVNPIIKAKSVPSTQNESRSVEPVGNSNSNSTIDVDDYNRRSVLNSDTPQYVEQDDTQDGSYINEFNGSEADFEMAERIRRFHNPKFRVHISDPGYYDIYMLSGLDWNVYEEGGYAWVTPTWTNPSYWNYMWAPSFYSGFDWRFNPYASWSWGWGGGFYPGWGWNSGYYPNWGWGGGYYPGWGGGFYPGWGGGHHHHGWANTYNPYKYSGGRNNGTYTGRTPSTNSSRDYNRSNVVRGGSTPAGSVRPSTRPSNGSATNSNAGRSARYNSTTTTKDINTSTENSGVYNRRSTSNSTEEVKRPTRETNSNTYNRSGSSNYDRGSSIGGGNYGRGSGSYGSGSTGGSTSGGRSGGRR